MRPCDTKSIAHETIGWWDSIHSGELSFVPALPLLSEYIPAYIPSHVLIVSGYTSAGKSQLLGQITCDCAGLHKAETVVFSVEDTRMEKMMTMMGVMTGIHKKPMLLGQVSEHMGTLQNAMSEIVGWPLSIYDDVYTLTDIEQIIEEKKPKVVIIDYVQNLFVEGGNIYERMSTAAQRIQQIANKHKATLIIASQIDNESAKNPDSPIISLKGAGELAAISHSVIHLRKGRKEGVWNEVEIEIKKNKAFGPCGDIKAQFNKSWTKIEQRQEAHQIHAERLSRKRVKDE